MTSLMNNNDRNQPSITSNASTANSMMVLFGIIAVLGAGILAFSDSSFNDVSSFNTSAFAQVSDTLPPPDVVSSLDDNADRELDDASGVTHVVIDGTIYALVTGRGDNGLQIIDISDPSNPNPVSRFTDSVTTFGNPVGVDTAVIGGDTFAIVGLEGSDHMIILNITDPTVTPTVRNVTAFSNFGDPVRPSGISVFVDDGTTYAVVADTHADAIRIASITDTASPGPFYSVTSGTVIDGRTFIMEDPYSTSIVTIAGDRYAVVASGSANANSVSNGIHIVNITTPSNPFFVSNVTNAENLIYRNTRDVATYVIDDKTYAITAAALDDGIQIIDISDPLNPEPKGSLADDPGGVRFDGAWNVDIMVSGGNTYAVVAGLGSTASGGFGHFHIININDPDNPTHVHNIINDGAISGALRGVDIANIGGIQYALVSNFGDSIFAIVQLTDLALVASDAPVISDTAVAAGALRLTPSSTPTLSDDTITLGSFARTASSIPTLTDTAVSVNPDAVSASTTPTLSDTATITAPTGPVTLSAESTPVLADTADAILPDAPYTPVLPPPTAVSALDDGDDSDYLLGQSVSVSTITIDGTLYAVSASRAENGIQITNITDPTNPMYVSDFTSADASQLANIWSVTTAHVGGNPYALVASRDADGGFVIINMSNPAIPTLASERADEGANGFDMLRSTTAVSVIYHTDGTPYALVGSNDDDSIHVVTITDPTTPNVETTIINGTGDYILESPRSISNVTLNDIQYVIVAGFDSDSLQIINMNDPTNPTHTSNILDNSTLALDSPHSVDTFVIGDDTFAIAASEHDNGVQIFNITDPAILEPMSNITSTDTDSDGNTLAALGGARFVDTVSIDENTYAVVAGRSGNGIQIIDVTNPTSPEPVYAAIDGADGFTELDGPFSVDIVDIDGSTYAIVASIDDGGLQIIDLAGAPIPTLSTSVTSPTRLTEIPFAISFTEGVTGFALGDILPSTGTASALDGSGSDYTFSITGITDPDLLTLRILEDVATRDDEFSSGNARSNLISITLDRVVPTITSAVALNSVSIQLTLSKPVTNNGTVGGDFALSGVASTNTFDGTITVSDDGNTITLTLSDANRIVSEDRNTATSITYTPNTDGTNLLDVAENPIATSTISVTIEDLDFVAPTVTLTTAVSSPTNLTTIPFIVSFSEPVTGFTLPEDVVIRTGPSFDEMEVTHITPQDLSPVARFQHTFGSEGTSEVMGNLNIFNEPAAVHINATGHIFVADSNNHRVLILDSLGGYLSHLGTTGTSGSGSTHLNTPFGVTTNSSGHILVANTGNDTVAIFDSSGNYQDIIDDTFTTPTDIVTNSSGHIFVVDGLGSHLIKVFDSSGENPSSFDGGDGTSPDDFSFPGGIAINSTDHIFVSNTNRHTVYVLDSDGNYLTHLGTNDTAGTDNASFDGPIDLAFDIHDNLYISDANNNRIQVYNSSLSYQYTMSGDSDEAPAFNRPQGIVINSTGFAHIADSNNNRIQVYNTNAYSFNLANINDGDNIHVDIQQNTVNDLAGNPNDEGADRISLSIETVVPTLSRIYTASNNTIHLVFSESIMNNGTVPGDYMINGVAAGSAIGTVSVSDYNDRILVLTLLSGNYITPADIATNNVTPGTISIDYTPNADGSNILDTARNVAADFADAQAVTIDSSIIPPQVTLSANIEGGTEASSLTTIPFTISFSEPFVGFEPDTEITVSQGGSIVDFNTAQPSFQRTFGVEGSNPGDFNNPVGILVNSSGYIYVVSDVNRWVQLLDSRGNYITHATGGPGDNFDAASHIAANSTNYIYVVSTDSDKIHIFDQNLVHVGLIDGFDANLADEDINTATAFASGLLGIAFDSNDNVYLADAGNNIVRIFDSNGEHIDNLGTAGAKSVPGAFLTPAHIAINSENHIYVGDTGHDRISVFDGDDSYRHLFDFNGTTADNNTAYQIDAQRGMVIDSNDDIYITESGHNRVLVFDGDTHLVRYHLGQNSTMNGNGDGIFTQVQSLALHEPSGSIYVADGQNNRIQIFAPTEATFGVTGFSSGNSLDVSVAAGVLHDLDGLPNDASNAVSLNIDTEPPTITSAVASSINTIHLTMSEPVSNNGTVPADYTLTGVTGASIGAISLSSNGTILTLTLTGGLIESGDIVSIAYMDNSPTSNILDAAENPLATRTITVTGIASLDFVPPVITLSSITDSPTNRGTIPFTVSFDKPVSGFTLDDVEAFATGRIAHQFSFGNEGMEDGNFTSPRGIAVNPVNNNIYVVDSDQHRVQIFDSEGNYVDQIGTTGTAGVAPNLNRPQAVAFSSSGDAYITSLSVGGNGNIQIYDTSNAHQSTIDLNSPRGITVNSAGHIFVADSGTDSVQIYDSSRVLQDTTLGGTVGDGANQFDNPLGVAINSTGHIFVADSNNNRISVFDSDGTPVTQFGNETGNGNNLDNPQYLAFDSDNNLYVTDSNNNRILVFDSNNQFQYRIGANDGNGDSGDGDGEFNDPIGIASDSVGNIHVVDAENHRVQIFSTMPEATPRNLVYTLESQLEFGNDGTENGNFTGPEGIAIHPTNNNIYVADINQHRVQFFDAAGDYVGQIGTGTQGSGENQLNTPRAVAFNSSGHIFITDRGSPNGRVLVYDASNTFQDTIIPSLTNPRGIAVNSTNHIFVVEPDAHRVQIFDGSGTLQDTLGGIIGNGANQFTSPRGIAINSTGFIYVADTGNNRTSVFDSSGNPVTQFGNETGGGNDFDGPSYLAFDIHDNLYVTDSGNNRILVFDSNNDYQYKVGASNGNGASGTDTGEFNNPLGIAFDSAGNLHIVDTGNDRVQIFSTLATHAAFGVTGYPNHSTLAVSIPIGAASDIGGLPNAAASDTLTFEIDRTAPTSSTPVAVAPSRIDIAVNEPVTNNAVDITDFTIDPSSGTDPTVESIVISPDGMTIQLHLTGPALSEDDNAIAFQYINDAAAPDNHFLDVANNTLPNITTNLENEIANSGPIITLTPDVSDPTNADTITFTVSFDRAVTGFEVPTDITVTPAPATATNPQIVPDLSGMPAHNANIGTGSAGFATNQLNDPTDVAINSTGYIYVADFNNHRISIFNSTGHHQDYIGGGANNRTAGDTNGTFDRPIGIFIDDNDRIYVSDFNNHRVQIFNSSNGYEGQFGQNGRAIGNFSGPRDIATNSSGHIFVADQNSHRVQIFDPLGNPLGRIGGGPPEDNGVTSGSGDDLLNSPIGIAINSTNHIFIADSGNNRTTVWDSSGSSSIARFGSDLGGLANFNSLANPSYIAFDSDNNFYVSDSGNHRIVVFDSHSTPIAQFGQPGSNNGSFNNPSGLAIDSENNLIHVADNNNNRIQTFARPAVTTFDVANAPDGETLTVSIPEGAVQEVGTGTDNVLAASVSRVIDRTAPTVENAVFTAIDTIQVTMSEDVMITSSNAEATLNIGVIGIASTIVASDDIITITLARGITEAESMDSALSLTLVGTAHIQDLATNPLVVSPTIPVSLGDVNFAVPLVIITPDVTSPTNADTITFTVTYDREGVTGLAQSDITTDIGSIANFDAAAGTFDVTGLTTGILNVTIAENAVTDTEGLQNAETIQSVTIDRAPPAVSGTPMAIGPATIIINFDEAITANVDMPTDFTITSSLATQPTVQSVEQLGTAGITLTLTGIALAEDTTNIAVAYTRTGTANTNAINDMLGNTLATLSSTAVTNAVATSGPIITLSTTATDPTNAITIPVSALFTRAPVSFAASNINVSSGTVSEPVGSGTEYTFNVVNPNDKETLTIQIDADQVSDGTNTNMFASDPLSIRIDRVGPMITSITAPDDIIDGTYGTGSVLDIQVVFDETVSFTSGTDGSSIKLELNINTADSTRLADYISGVDSDTLLFRYTIVTNDRSSGDLDVTALTFDSTIANVTDVDGLNADLMTLPGSANSLAGNRNIIVDARAEGPTISARGDTNYIQSSDTSTLPDVITISSSNTNATLVLPDAFMNTATNYTIPDALDVIHTRADGGDITITFEPNTHITGTGFDGQVILPNDLGNDCGELPLGEMGDSNLVSCIQIGLNNGELALSKPVRILLEGQFNNTALFTNDGGITVTEITQECDANSDGTLSDTEADFMAPECHIDDEENDNLIIWTNHFTVFGSSNNDTRSSGGGNNGDSTAPSFTTSFDEGTNTISIGDIGIAPDRFATSYTLDAPVTVRTGSTLPITLTLYDNISWKSISHVELCMNKQVSTNQICDSDTKIIWDVTDSGNTENNDGTVITANNLEIIDPNDIIQDVSLVITEVDSHVATFEYDVRFGGAMSESDLQIYAWDSRRNSVSFTVVDAIVVTGTSSGNGNNNNNNNDRSSSGTGSSGGSGSGGAGGTRTTSTTSTTTPTTTPTTDNDSPQTSTAVSDGASIVTSNGTRITEDNSLPNASFHNEQIKKWAGFSAESITDGEILASFDITDNPAEDIILPSWTKDILGKWAGQDKITAKQVKIALSFMYDSIES